MIDLGEKSWHKIIMWNTIGGGFISRSRSSRGKRRKQVRNYRILSLSLSLALFSGCWKDTKTVQLKQSISTTNSKLPLILLYAYKRRLKTKILFPKNFHRKKLYDKHHLTLVKLLNPEAITTKMKPLCINLCLQQQ